MEEVRGEDQERGAKKHQTTETAITAVWMTSQGTEKLNMTLQSQCVDGVTLMNTGWGRVMVSDEIAQPR